MIWAMQRLTPGRIESAFVVLALAVWAGPAAAAGSGAASAPAARASAAQDKAARTTPAKPVDINSASRAQLKTLPGIGDAEAAKIIAARPYRSKAELATRNVIPLGIVLSLKDRIIAIQKLDPKGRPEAPGTSTKRP